MTNSVIGQAIKETRKQADLTVEQLAGMVPADDRTIFRYEATGKIRPDVLVRLAAVMKAPFLLTRYCAECPVGREKCRQGANLKTKRKPGQTSDRADKNLLKRFYHMFS